MPLNNALASCCRVGVQCPCVEWLMQLREFYWLQNPLIFQVNLKVARICAAIMWKHKYAKAEYRPSSFTHTHTHIYVKELALYWQVLHYVMTPVRCTASKICCSITELSTAKQELFSVATQQLMSALRSMLNAGLLGSTVSCTTCPLQIPIASNNNNNNTTTD